MLTVRELLASKGSDLWTIEPDASVYEALQLMASKNIGAVLVKEVDTLVGIFSERDYARKLVLLGRTSRETHVRDLMTRDVVVVAPNETIATCLKTMTELHFRHIPVMEGGRLIGIVTIGDVGKAIIADQADTIQVLETYIRGR